MDGLCMTKDFLYLGSQSQGRRELLATAGINFKLLEHTSDESFDFANNDFYQGIQAIAQAKMDSLILPAADNHNTDYCYVVTADTLTRACDTGEILGKPQDKAHALTMLERKGASEVVTGCCVRKYERQGTMWVTKYNHTWTNSTEIEFFVPQGYREYYLETIPQALYASGAGVVEGRGLLFLKSVNGCFASVTGLPLYEVRQALEFCGFNFF